MGIVNMDAANYKCLLKQYIDSLDETVLYRAEQVSKEFIKNNISPDEIVNIHNQALAELYPDLNEGIHHSMNFLLETMISYGLAHQEFRALREEQSKLKLEISIAANVQKTLLATSIPRIEGLDIGAISSPANQMNGDYYHFVEEESGSVGIAIADVIGKGIPAALCMSMIKYSMESYAHETMQPNMILKILNRVVERNVDLGMFVTMFYGQYIPSTSIFKYASAGHEPGFYYQAKTKQFSDIHTDGLVLGVIPETVYEQYEIQVQTGDMIILLTDGVTECRYGDRFIERNEVLEVIKQFMHLPAQQIVNGVYKYFERIQDFQMRDDFTLIVIKKED